MAANFPKKLLFRLGEIQEGQGFDLDKKDYSELPGPSLTLNPVSVTGFEDVLPEYINREVLPGQNGALFANNEIPVRDGRRIKIKLAVHDGRPDGPEPKDPIVARNAYDEMNYWLYANARESKLHVWDTRYVNYFANGVKTTFVPGTAGGAFEVEADLLCADPFMYANHIEAASHPWSYTQSDLYWSGSTTGRCVGDEVVYPLFSITNTNATLTLTTGFKLTNLLTGRSYEYFQRVGAPSHRPTIGPGEQFFVDFANTRGYVNGVSTNVKTVGSLWLLPDGQDQQFRLEPKFAAGGSEPPADDVLCGFQWRPRFQI